MKTDSIKQLNLAMEYIEEHLTDTIDFGKLARIACCSEYHFRRVFSFLAGIPLGEYIRQRRLAIAATLLENKKQKIIDVAMMLGYESPDSFSKAFFNMHGITPSKARENHVSLKSFPPMTFQLTIKGGNKMDYRIVHKEAFNVVGFKKRIGLQFEGINPQMSGVVDKLTPDVIAELKGLCNTDPKGIINVSDFLEERTVEGSELEQYVGVATTKPAPSGYDTLPVKESDWAVFTVVGSFPKAVQDTWARIYTEWFPASGFQSTGGPELLWYESPDLTKPDCKNEIWIPVEKKNSHL